MSDFKKQLGKTEGKERTIIKPSKSINKPPKFEGQSTMDIPVKMRFDIDKLQSYMEAHIIGFTGTLSAKKFGLGQSNPTYLLTTDTKQKYVMRKQPPGKLIKGAHAVDREAKVISILNQTNFPVPKVYILCTDVEILGSLFYIMSFKQGEIYDNGMAAAPVRLRTEMLYNMVRTLALLHTQDIDTLQLSTYGKRTGFYSRQIKTLSKISAMQVERGGGKVMAIPRLNDLLTWFGTHLPPDVCTLIHGDYKPDNIVFRTNSTEVIAVLDWELSTLGHPLSDLANTCLPYYFPNNNGLYPSFLNEQNNGLIEGIPTQQELHKVYV